MLICFNDFKMEIWKWKFGNKKHRAKFFCNFLKNYLFNNKKVKINNNFILLIFLLVYIILKINIIIINNICILYKNQIIFNL